MLLDRVTRLYRTCCAKQFRNWLYETSIRPLSLERWLIGRSAQNDTSSDIFTMSSASRTCRRSGAIALRSREACGGLPKVLCSRRLNVSGHMSLTRKLNHQATKALLEVHDRPRPPRPSPRKANHQVMLNFIRRLEPTDYTLEAVRCWTL